MFRKQFAPGSFRNTALYLLCLPSYIIKIENVFEYTNNYDNYSQLFLHEVKKKKKQGKHSIDYLDAINEDLGD